MLKKLLWAIVIVAVLISMPALKERVNVEKANDTYELVIPYGQIEEMGHWLSREDALSQLRAAGLKTISVEPVNLFELEKKEYVLEVARNYLVGNYPEYIKDIPDGGGMYFRVVEKHPLLARVFEVFDREYELIAKELNIPFRPVEVFELGNQEFIFIPYRNDLRLDEEDEESQSVVGSMKEKALGYDFEQIELLTKFGFSVIPRLPNNFNFIGSIQEHFIYDEFLKLRQYGDQVLFLGGEVPGYPEPTFLKEMGSFFKENGFEILVIEGTEQKGMEQLLRINNLENNVIRLFSVPTKGKGFEDDPLYVNQAIRALNERNIRIVFFNPLRLGQTYSTAAEAKLGLDRTIDFLQNVQNDPRNQFTFEKTEPFQQLSQPAWLKLVVYFGSLAFALLFFIQLFTKRYVTAILATAGFALVLGVQFLTGNQLLLKAIVLFIALIGPVFAVISVQQVKSWRSICWQYLKSLAIALISAWFIVSILYGTDFIVKLDSFTGVKILSITPTIVVAFVIVQRMANGNELVINLQKGWQRIWELLQGPIKYWHIIFAVVIGFVIYFYVGRTGNQGIVIPGELFIRQWLEESLSARPRTTAFLIGFPLFILGLYGTMLKKKWAPFALIFGTLGFSSSVGTFTHLHTPLVISLLRTFNSVTLGFIFGVILIRLVSYLEKKITLSNKKRF